MVMGFGVCNCGTIFYEEFGKFESGLVLRVEHHALVLLGHAH